MRLARHVHHRVLAAEAVDRLGDEAGVEGGARRLDLRLAVAAGRLRFFENAAPCPGDAGVAQQRARHGQAASRQVDRGRAVPVLAENRLDRADGVDRAGNQRRGKRCESARSDPLQQAPTAGIPRLPVSRHSVLP